MKKVVKLLSLVVLTMMLWTVVVKADDCGGIDIYFEDKEGTGYTDLNSQFAGRPITVYTFEGSDGTKFKGYCHDPRINPAVDATGKPTSDRVKMGCVSTLVNPENTDDTTNAFNAGLVEILTSNDSDAVKDTAKMIYQMYWLVKDTTKENPEDTTNEYRYWVNKYMSEDSKVKGLLSSLRRKLGTGVIRGNAYADDRIQQPTGNYNMDMDSVKNLVIKGLEKALNHTEVAQVTSPDPVKTRTEKEENGEKVYYQTITYKIKISNFNSESAKVRLNFDCPKCAEYGINSKFYLNSKEVSLADLGNINLATKDYITDGNGTIEFKMEFSANEDFYCEEVNYTLKVLYYDESVGVQAYDVSQVPGMNTLVQAFYIVAENTSERSVTIQDTISMCSTNCKDVQEKCNAGDARACKIFEDKYHSVCTFCSTSIPTVECKTCEIGKQKFDIVEGYNVDASTCEAPTDENLDIKTCVANENAQDTAGNSYKVSALSKPNVSNYTNVYCKEDFHFNMPGTISVNSGSYFVLNAKINGTKRCYTDQITDDGVRNKVIEKAKESVEAWETYKNLLNKKAAVEAGRRNKNGSGIGYYLTYDSEECSPVTTTINGKETTYTPHKFKPKVVLVYDVTKCEWGSPGKCTTTPAGGEETIIEGTYGECSHLSFDEITDSSISNFLDSVSSQIGSKYSYTVSYDNGPASKGIPNGSGTVTVASGAMGDLTVGTSGIYTVVTDWNNASGYMGDSFSGQGMGDLINPYPFEQGWRMTYAFAPLMNFWYQESYMNDVLTDQLMLAKPYNVEKDTNYKLCTGEVSNDFKKCDGSEANWKTEHKEGETYDVYDIWACDLGGCRWFSYIQSKVKYSTGSLDAEAEYVTPTQFYAIYPTPGIVTAKQGVDISNGSPLEYGLPVALDATNGARSYMLWVKDLGEYYNDNKLGRIWGNEKSVLPTALKESSACLTENSALQYEKNVGNYYHGDGIYSCEYDVNVCDASCKAPIIDESGKYTYTNDKGEFKSKVDKATYEADCCPNGKCPTEVVNKCAIGKDEAGNLVYYDDKGNVVGPDVYEAKCCKNGNCPVECKNCLYNGKDLMVDYHQVTNENINPTDREMGQNWNWDDNIDSALELKAYVTTKEIEESGNSVFDIDFDNPKEDGDFAMQVKMDGQLISKIRTWNKKPENENYLSNTLECYDLEDSKTDRVYKNVYCYSTFIDYLLSEEDSAKKIKFAGVGLNRPTSKSERKANSSSYFTNWISVNASDWGITDKIALDYTSHFGKEYNLETGVQIDYHVGPSWK